MRGPGERGRGEAQAVLAPGGEGGVQAVGHRDVDQSRRVEEPALHSVARTDPDDVHPPEDAEAEPFWALCSALQALYSSTLALCSSWVSANLVSPVVRLTVTK